MDTPNMKTEAKLAAAFMAKLVEPTKGLLDNKAERFTTTELHSVIALAKKFYFKLRISGLIPDYLLIPICNLFAVQIVKPILGFQVAQLCEARMIYAVENYDPRIEAYDSPRELAARYAAKDKLYNQAIDIDDVFNEIHKGTSTRSTFAYAVAILITATMIEVALSNPAYHSGILFDVDCPITPANGAILIKWMQSCGIPLIHFK